MALLAVLLLTPIPAYWLWAVLTWPEPPKVTLAAALAALDEHDDPLAAYHAKRLFEAEIYAPWTQGGPAYVLGILAARRGAVESAKSRDYQKLAVNYLSEARQSGFPAGRETHGLFTLGETLVRLGRHVQSVEPLREALAATRPAAAGEPSEHGRDGHDGPPSAVEDTTHAALAEPSATEIHRLLCTAYQRAPAPRLTEALEHNAKYLTDSRLSPPEREAALLERAQLYFELDQPHSCRDTLAQVASVTENHRPVLFLQARLLLREARHLRDLPASKDADAKAAAGAAAPQKPSSLSAAALAKYQETLETLAAASRRASLIDEVAARRAVSAGRVPAGDGRRCVGPAGIS